MASPGPSSPPASRSTRRRAPSAASNAGVLPPDVLFDVLLRLPAKELCRLRAVCHGWRSLTMDPLFASAHAARHPDPLFLASFRDDRMHICVADLSGNVVKRIPNADGHQLLCTRLDLACAASVGNSCHVIDPATGSVHVLPESPAVAHLYEENLHETSTSFVFGRVATTGEYKVLRSFAPIYTEADVEHYHYQLFEVFTINGASSSGSGHAHWRALMPRYEGWRYNECFVEVRSAIVIGEVVYFKVDIAYDEQIGLDRIVPFDLEREEWMEVLRGPISDIFFTDEYDNHLEDYRSLGSELTLAELRGSLGLVHYRKYHHIMDLWVLKDFDSFLWVKEHIIQIEPIFPTTEGFVKSLFMLEDGRIVIHFPVTGLLFIYDPRTNTSAQVEMRHLDAVAMYTGNLLSLQVGDMM
ncbi:unnamed protein product [Urochloa decumbens]|uniref:F-box domain-containing protein n=1 Tax=Urochloa decumbens TaxID=240449 RepID=A0ABC9FPT1_9POAL